MKKALFYQLNGKLMHIPEVKDEYTDEGINNERLERYKFQRAVRVGVSPTKNFGRRPKYRNANEMR